MLSNAFAGLGGGGGGGPSPSGGGSDSMSTMDAEEAEQLQKDQDMFGGGDPDADSDDEPLATMAAGLTGVKRPAGDLERTAKEFKTSSEEAAGAAEDLKATAEAAACMVQSVHEAATNAGKARAKAKTAEDVLEEAKKKRAFYDTAVQELGDIVSKWPKGGTAADREAAVKLAEDDTYRQEVEAARTAVQKAGTAWRLAANAARKHKMAELVKRVSVEKNDKNKRVFSSKQDALLNSQVLKDAVKADAAAVQEEEAVISGVKEQMSDVTKVLRGLTTTKNASAKADEALAAVAAAAAARDEQQQTVRAAAASASVARQRSSDADSDVRGAANACSKAAELLEGEGEELASDCRHAVDNLAMMRYELKTMMVQYDKYIQQAEEAVEEEVRKEGEKCDPVDLAAMKVALRVAKETYDALDEANVEHTIEEAMADFENKAGVLTEGARKAKAWDDTTYLQKWEEEVADEEVEEDEEGGEDDEGGEEDADQALEELEASASIVCTVMLETERRGETIPFPYPVQDGVAEGLAKHLQQKITERVLGQKRVELPIEVAVDMPVEPHAMEVRIGLAKQTKQQTDTPWGARLQAAETVMHKDDALEGDVARVIADVHELRDAFRSDPFFEEVATPGADGKSVARLLRWINGHLEEQEASGWFGARAKAMPDVFADLSENERAELNAEYQDGWIGRVKVDPAYYETVKMRLQRIRDREHMSMRTGGAGIQGRFDTVIGTLKAAAETGDAKAKDKLSEVGQLVETINGAGSDAYVAGWTVKSGKKWYDDKAATDAKGAFVSVADKWTLLVAFLNSYNLE